MITEIGLVSCVKTKREEPATPKNLYASDYFEKMRAYAEEYHDDWWILSAKHGLLDPDGDPIEPYDETLSGARVAVKREWAERVAEQLDDEGLLTEGVTPVLHAGKDYYGELLPLIGRGGAKFCEGYRTSRLAELAGAPCPRLDGSRLVRAVPIGGAT